MNKNLSNPIVLWGFVALSNIILIVL
jgi:hypothetical protein